MASNGTRKRFKVRWMAEVDGGETAHAFPLMTGGTLRDYTMCGLPLRAMHHWTRTQPGRGIIECANCKAALKPGARA